MFEKILRWIFSNYLDDVLSCCDAKTKNDIANFPEFDLPVAIAEVLGESFYMFDGTYITTSGGDLVRFDYEKHYDIVQRMIIMRDLERFIAKALIEYLNFVNYSDALLIYALSHEDLRITASRRYNIEEARYGSIEEAVASAEKCKDYTLLVEELKTIANFIEENFIFPHGFTLTVFDPSGGEGYARLYERQVINA